MKSCIVFALFVAAASAAAITTNSKDAVILQQTFDNIGVEGYGFGFETSDGKTAQESAVLKNVGTENEALEVRGQYSYVDLDGKVHETTYTADENGFHPSGADIPQLPQV
ncbi:flexible cuticle protein 12-like [Bombyx mandarina]|uniref:Flexible cuticle protein 12-like n=2 Tax=Bombyx TaxID=7090 RepID=A0A6J2KBS7_BOMMA|nr:cuticular protein RR-1 motif 5 precursor [Bombyx mori]XP_028039108.1 flexible cuticle protein 12-like [Bombyx mandarina]FAA00507.1 TPA: putative cuticle protein [Bombyx mori]